MAQKKTTKTKAKKANKILITKRKKEVDRLYSELDKIDPKVEPELYYELIKSIEMLDDMKFGKVIRDNLGSIITVMGSIGGIVLILGFEGGGNVIHSKALSFILRK